MNHEKVLSMLVESVKIWQILQIIANMETMDTHTNIHITETRIQTQTTLGEIKRLATLCVEAQAERTNTQPKNKLKQPLGMLATKAEAAQTQTHTTMTKTNNNI